MRRKWILAVLFLAFPACSKKKAEEKAPSSALNISGLIQIDPKLLNQAKDSDTIYLIARPAAGGPPLAVEKFQGRNYPYSFQLTEKHLMTEQDTTDTPLNLTVRVDRDGDAMTRSAGDLAGTYAKNPVALESGDVTITVDEVLK